MIGHLRDPANAITAVGLVFSFLAIACISTGRIELGVALVLWALLADHLDGVVAARTANRSSADAGIGKNLDSFADLVSGAVVPSLVLCAFGRDAPLCFVAAGVLLVAGALRLSYFNVSGLSGTGRFTGVPLSYDVPLLALAILVRPLLPPSLFPSLLAWCFLVLSVLHVSKLQVPRTSGVGYLLITCFSVAASLLISLRNLT